MAKKSGQQDQGKPFDYFSEVKAAQRQEKADVTSLVTALRTDMVPSSHAQPAKERVITRDRLKSIVGILLGLVILGLFLFTLIGPGRPVFEHNLAILAHKDITPTQTPTSTKVIPTSTPPIPTKTPLPSPSITSTRTPVVAVAVKSTKVPATPTQTATPAGCLDVASITLADVGKTLCVKGTLLEAVTYPTNFMMIFNHQPGSFYWVSYDLVWSKAKAKNCYQVTGIIDRVGNSPVLVFNYDNLPEACP